ncbi:hypothetical protein AAFF_G00220650 [Aldrovandia affinis]|uniref:Uncharacterized protein n=1 Tax=Aldrovandia affinis TaxID=143900 RepID=A0AAD7RFX7_9TELE|nr:hypothetical protein AAFF_G00220650 [Aldrovandia affinis]
MAAVCAFNHPRALSRRAEASSENDICFHLHLFKTFMNSKTHLPPHSPHPPPHSPPHWCLRRACAEHKPPGRDLRLRRLPERKGGRRVAVRPANIPTRVAAVQSGTLSLCRLRD